ncbi:hypothetical protein DACRYDRAFT_112683 [Dacryopinax primogenitus]|uniref:Uncharacterized protein n=1 Tax=Dacryopinax primogenitus (strain DJM 731) TaxID=1858805 RepID=M5FYB9_DACPD|nr:uncharacterized protein DACRYDRAFT_112683 [Dacryopinax primogenitus]EJT96522.1 hypothetical protein DACRYDRAFT_112683 [Dacryopinax primogenitus]
MAPRKRKNGEPATALVEKVEAHGTIEVTLAESEPVKINNAHLREVKDALDGALIERTRDAYPPGPVQAEPSTRRAIT